MEHLLSAPLYSGVPAISSNIRLDRKFFPGTNTIAYSVEDVSDERNFLSFSPGTNVIKHFVP
jgi:hypothetical protein